jgi:protein-ribulosamine 3-kinase
VTTRPTGSGAAVDIPSDIRTVVEALWSDQARRSVRIGRASAVAGGSISPSARIESAAGDVAFLKWSREPAGSAMFEEEARSLRILASTDTVRVPDVLGLGGGGDGVAWIMLEWLPPGRPSRATWRILGMTLARLHHVRAEDFGWDSDNFIGVLPQANGRMADWPTFWRERRLRPQLDRAIQAGHLGDDVAARFGALFEALDERLAVGVEEGPSMLHGDLWSGNVHVGRGGAAAVLDPACYHGHREVDLAMTELFGGFDPAFYQAYEEAWPLDDGYRRGRRSIYQLYYLLAHVNLFGGGYVGSTLAALERAGF